MDINFIKILDPDTGKDVGYVAIKKGTEFERIIVNRFIDEGFIFHAATEDDFCQFDGSYIRRFDDGVFCTEFPME